MQSQNFNHVQSCPFLPGALGESLKKSQFLESSSDILNMEEGGTIIGKGNSLDYSKANINPRHHNVNSHNSMSIETDV